MANAFYFFRDDSIKEGTKYIPGIPTELSSVLSTDEVYDMFRLKDTTKIDELLDGTSINLYLGFSPEIYHHNAMGVKIIEGPEKCIGKICNVPNTAIVYTVQYPV